MIDKAAKDHELLKAIQDILSGKEWNSETVEIVAELMNSYGYNIDPPCEAKEADGFVCQNCGRTSFNMILAPVCGRCRTRMPT